MAVASGPTGRDGPHAFVEDLANPVLNELDRHHFSRVVRLRVGDPLTVSDGVGRWRACRMGVDLAVDGEIRSVPKSERPITIAFALIKGQRPELVTQKLTELGVDVIRPFIAERSVVRLDPTKAVGDAERLGRVAREAAMQSRRCWLPVVHPVASFADIAQLSGVVVAERDGPPLRSDAAIVAVGPEGGWSPAERDSGLLTAGLGGHILRAETAAIAAAVLLGAARYGTLPQQ